MACARSATCRLVKIDDTRLRTVFCDNDSRCAIEVLSSPDATSSSTSRSRSVSCGNTTAFDDEIAVK